MANPRGEVNKGHERAKEQPLKPPLLSTLLSNVRSTTNKIDELRLQPTVALYSTEAWLQPSAPDSAIELACGTVHRHESHFGKNKGGAYASTSKTADART